MHEENEMTEPITEAELEIWVGLADDGVGLTPNMTHRLIAEVRRLRTGTAITTARELVQTAYQYAVGTNEFILVLRCLENDLIDRTVKDILRLIALGKAVEEMPMRWTLERSYFDWEVEIETASSDGWKQYKGKTPLEALQAARNQK